MPDRLIILAIDTSLSHCAAALVRKDEVCALTVDDQPTGHTERLAPMIADLFQQSGLMPADVQRVVVTTGPGSFTGIRTGLAFARSFAMALGVPCIGISTLRALAGVYTGRVLALVDGRTCVFMQLFVDGVGMGEPQVFPSAGWRAPAQALRPDTVVSVGIDGLEHDFQGCIRHTPIGVDPVVLATVGGRLSEHTSPARASYLRDAGARLPI